MEAENFMESSKLKNTNELDSFNKDVQTFHPLFPPFGQSKSRKASKIAKDDPEASSDIKDIKSQVYSSIKARKLLSKTDDNFSEEKIYSEIDKREYLEELVQRDKQEEEKEKKKEAEKKEEEEEEEEDPLEWYDADYQEREENLEEERDYRRRQVLEDSKEEKKLWSLKKCDSLASITTEDDIDEDYTETSEPLLAHPLILPYARTPRPRFFSNDENVEYVLKSLQKRPPSPERHILPQRFDICSRKKRFEEEWQENEIKNYFQKLKDRISQELMQMFVNGVEADIMISTLVLQLILEEVVFTIDFVDHGIDVHTLITMVTTIALRELKISWLSESSDSRFDENSKSFFSRSDSDDNSKGIRHSKIRSELRTVRIPKLRTTEYLHRSLSWHLICPSHERGYTGGRFYGNLRNRIGEILEDRQIELERAYVPDVACYHLKERDIFEKRTTLQTQKEGLSFWKGRTKNIVELPFYLFDFV